MMASGISCLAPPVAVRKPKLDGLTDLTHKWTYQTRRCIGLVKSMHVNDLIEKYLTRVWAQTPGASDLGALSPPGC
jgi:hypothetical protein